MVIVNNPTVSDAVVGLTVALLQALTIFVVQHNAEKRRQEAEEQKYTLAEALVLLRQTAALQTPVSDDAPSDPPPLSAATISQPNQAVNNATS